MIAMSSRARERVFAVPEGPPVQAELLSVQAVAGLLGCSWRHVYRMADTGRMPAPVKLGALSRWRRVEILAWIAAGCPSERLKGGA
ncbi:MAG: hypothetical protein AMXMBFR7_49110 [Planctomycetota bacterium]